MRQFQTQADILRQLGKLGPYTKPDSDEIDPAAVRSWAAEHGIEVAPKGRIPASITKRYKEATGR